MFNYLYYKLFQVSLKSSLRDIPEFIAAVFFGGLLSVNLLVINTLLAKLDMMPFLFSNKEWAGVFVLVLIGLTMLYYRKKRYNLILKKYSQESNKKRIIGNIIVAVYAIVSILLIFGVAFLKIGKL